LTNRSGEKVHIRGEASNDIESVRKLHELAFNSTAEAHLVDLLRARGKAIISLVAEFSGAIVGHILFSPVSIDPPAPAWRALGLAPVGVMPEWQRQGIGKALIMQGLESCRARGFDLVVVLGAPAYYSRFNFKRALDHGLGNEYQANEHFMVLELMPSVLNKFTGLVKYTPEFNEIGA